MEANLDERTPDQHALAYADNIIATLREPFVVLDKSLRVRTANAAFYRNFHVSKAETEGRFVYELGNGQWDIPQLRTLLPQVLSNSHPVENFEVDHAFPALGPRNMLLNARRFPPESDDPDFVLLAIEDITDRRRAEQWVRESEQRFRHLLDKLPAAAYTCDAEGLITYFNPYAVQVWGREPQLNDPADRFCGSFKLLSPDGSPIRHDECWMALALRDGKEYHGLEVVIEHPDGSRRIGLAHANPFYDVAGYLSGAVNVVVDITDRKQAEAATQHSEVRYRRLFQTAKDGILILDSDTGKVIDANPFMTTLLGYSHAEFLGKELWEIGLFRDIDESRAAYRALQEQGYVRYENLPLESQSGQKVEVEFVSNVYAENDHQVVQCNIRDITERSQMQVKLRAAEQRLRFVMDSMPQKIFTATPNGDVDYFNPIWTHYTGLSFEQIRDWAWTQFIHPDDVAENVRVWKHSIDFVKPFQFEHRFRRADGQFRWHITRAVPLRDAEGAVVMWVGSNTDIHEQRQMADELQKHAAELAEADRRKSEFLAMLAHELRNPLAPIRNAVQILRLAGDEQAVQAVSEMMDRQVGQMVRLVDDLLDVSRISRGKIELRMERVELAQVVNHAVEAARSLYKSMNHDLTVSLAPQPIYLNGDPARLTQVVGNLLNNACKFTDKGGRIRLTVEPEGEQAVIRVRDNGIGVAADQLPLIFGLFTQVDSSLERSGSGLGIGLSLVENLVEMHGGTVEVHSAGLGQGSEFVVRLPVVVETPKLPPEPAASELSPATARRILVVDDNRDSATSLAMLLKLLGHETHTAYDGLEAVEAAATFRPDVVLLDIGLPKLNGYEAARQIRQQPWGKGMVLAALTGWGQEEDRQRSEEVGFDAHMVKPVDLDALRSLLARPELYGRSESISG